MPLQTGKHADSPLRLGPKSTPAHLPKGGATEGIRIFLLREPRVERAKQKGTTSVPLPHAQRLLLGALVIHRSGPLQRSTLAGMMWPDCAEVRVRACLNTAIWRLRRILEPRGVQRGTYLIVRPSGEVYFNAASPHWIDIHALERRALELIDCPVERIHFDDAECFLDFLRTDTSEFLDGQGDEWVLRAREHLRRLCLDALDQLLRSFDHRGALERGLDLALHILEFDPLREDVHRHVMRMFAASGQRALAMRQFEKCRELLFRELSVAPMPDTVALYRSIANSSAMTSADAPSTPDVRAALHSVQAELRDALQHLHAGLALLARVEEARAATLR